MIGDIIAGEEYDRALNVRVARSDAAARLVAVLIGHVHVEQDDGWRGHAPAPDVVKTVYRSS